MDSSTERPSRDAWSRIQAILFHPGAFLALLILATLVDRTRGLPTPISGIRETQSAMIAGNLGRDLDEIGPRAILYPRVDYAGEAPGYLLLEFPLVNLAGVFFMRAFDLPPETAYRLPSLLLFLAMQAFLFAFVRARFGTVEAVASTLLVSYFPVSVKLSVELMPEQGVATAFMAGLYFFDRHLEGRRAGQLIAATVCFGSMLLIKSTSGLLLLVPLGLFQLRRGGLRELFRLRYALAVAACVVPLAFWTLHAGAVNRGSVLDDGTRVSDCVTEYLRQGGRWPLLVSFKTYAGIAEMMSTAYERPSLLLFALGLAYGIGRGKHRVLLTVWLAAFLPYFVVLPFHTSTHWYYTHGYATFIALGGAVLLGPLVRSGIRLVQEKGRRAASALFAVAALAFVLNSRAESVPRFYPKIQRFGSALKSVTSPHALGILSSLQRSSQRMEPRAARSALWDGQLFYFSDTRGWRRSFVRPEDTEKLHSLVEIAATSTNRSKKFMRTVNEKIERLDEKVERLNEKMERFTPRPPELTLEFIEEKRLLGASFLAHFGDPKELASLLPDVYRHLTMRYQVLKRDSNGIVFSLRE